MARRQPWNPKEDEIISELLSAYETANKKVKWTEIAEDLVNKFPGWKRNGKQCRERWLNHLRPTLNKEQTFNSEDLQLLFKLIRTHGKKWSLIARELPTRSDNTIKNFFYASIRKGLRNLNVYNTEIRAKRIYKLFNQDVTQKLLSIHDTKKVKDLSVFDASAFELADEIRENLMTCSREDVKDMSAESMLNEEFYEELNKKMLRFCKLCKFKKLKGRKCLEEEQKFEVFTRRQKNPQVTSPESSYLDYSELKSCSTEMKDSNLQQKQSSTELKVEYEEPAHDAYPIFTENLHQCFLSGSQALEFRCYGEEDFIMNERPNEQQDFFFVGSNLNELQLSLFF